MSECRSPLTTASRTVALFFELADDTLRQAPALLLRALRSEEVQNAIRGALREQADDLLRAQAQQGTIGGQVGVQLTDTEAQAFAQQLQRSFLTGLRTSLGRQIEQSGRGRALTTAAKQLGEDLLCAPSGAFLTPGRGLVVLGILSALGGGVAMYVSRWGDPVTQLVEGLAVPVTIGRIQLEGKVTRFQPSTRTVGASISLSGSNFTRIVAGQAPGALGARLSIAGLVSDGVGQGTVTGEAIIPLGGSTTLSALAQAGLRVGTNYSEITSAPLAGPNPAPTPDFTAALRLRVADAGLTAELYGRVTENRPSGGLFLGLDRRLGGVGIRGGLGLEVSPGAAVGPRLGTRSPIPWSVPSETLRPPEIQGGAFAIGGAVQLQF